MRQSQGPPFSSSHGSGDLSGEELLEAESRRLTPSIGLTHDSDKPTDSSNEDFLFHLYRGSELLQDNRVHEAKEELERALHLQPRDSKGQDLLAVVYFRLGLYPRAIQIYEQLRRRNPNDTALLLNLALCYLKTGQPQLARRDLEHLLSLNPTHARAWGYLGLSCERLGDLKRAEHAFAQGGHRQMATRIAARRSAEPSAVDVTQPSQEIRDVAGAAYQELDAGELSFALAEPTGDTMLEERVAQSWRPHELGQILENVRGNSPDAPLAPDVRAEVRDAISIAPSVPQLGHNHAFNRRPTLIAPVGAPPAHEVASNEYASVERIPSPNPPSFAPGEAAAAPPVPSMRWPVVAVPSPFGPPRSHEAPPYAPVTRTLPPPPVTAPEAPPDAPIGNELPAETRASNDASLRPKDVSVPPARSVPPAVTARFPSSAPQAIAPAAPPPAARPSDEVLFPSSGVALHPSGVALVRTTSDEAFATRLESIRTQQSGISLKLLERHAKGKPNGESFGGVASPMVLASGDGQLVLSARPGRKLTVFAVLEDMCFVREEVLLGFGGRLVFENGRLTTGEGEWVPVVQFRGEGPVLLEAMGEILSLPVHPDRSLTVRREAILGWFGRLVPRALSAGDAPCGQRGLVSFAGQGRVLVASV